MPDFILLMHDDAEADDAAWEPYIETLIERGCFQGGSAIGEGVAMRKAGTPGRLASELAGFIRVSAETLDEAKTLLDGNPHYEAGGTVEIRELPESD
jgi:hypothetical protein